MCGIFGFISPGIKNKSEFRAFASNLMRESQIRGSDATGFAGVGDNRFFTDKNDDAASYFSRLSIEWRNFLRSEKMCAIGHTRAATSGDPRNNANNHPFHGPRYTLVHNGMVWMHEFVAEKRDFKLATDCDSEVFLHYIETAKTLREGLIKIAADLDKISGFSLAILDRQTKAIHLFRNKDNPCVVARLIRWNATVFASTPSIMMNAAQHFFGGVPNMIGEVEDVGDTPAYAMVTIAPDGGMVTEDLSDDIKAVVERDGTIHLPTRNITWDAEVLRAIHGGASIFRSGSTAFVTSSSSSSTSRSTADETQKIDTCKQCLRYISSREQFTCDKTGCPIVLDQQQCPTMWHGYRCQLNRGHSCDHKMVDVDTNEQVVDVSTPVSTDVEEYNLMDCVEILPPSLLNKTGTDDIVGLLQEIREPCEDYNLSDFGTHEYMKFAAKSYDKKLDAWRDMSDKRIEEMGDGEYLAYFNFVSAMLECNVEDLEFKLIE